MLKLLTRGFFRWAKKHRIKLTELHLIIKEMENGLLGDRLGAFVFKKRVKLTGRGKRDGARFIICYKEKDKVLFLEGYAKNEQQDLSPVEIQAYRVFAKEFIKLSNKKIMQSIKDKVLIELSEESI